MDVQERATEFAAEFERLQAVAVDAENAQTVAESFGHARRESVVELVGYLCRELQARTPVVSGDAKERTKEIEKYRREISGPYYANSYPKTAMMFEEIDALRAELAAVKNGHALDLAEVRAERNNFEAALVIAKAELATERAKLKVESVVEALAVASDNRDWGFRLQSGGKWRATTCSFGFEKEGNSLAELAAWVAAQSKPKRPRLFTTTGKKTGERFEGVLFSSGVYRVFSGCGDAVDCTRSEAAFNDCYTPPVFEEASDG